MASWRRWPLGREVTKAARAGGWEGPPKGDSLEPGQGWDTRVASQGRQLGEEYLGRLRQGGGGFECLILMYVKDLPASESLLSPMSILSTLSSCPHFAYQPSPELGAKSPVYLSRSPAPHPRRPQLQAQLLIDRLSGCLLFWWVTGVCGKWPSGGGGGGRLNHRSLERG